MINDKDIPNLHLHNIHRMILVNQMSKVPNVKVVVHDEIVNAPERVPWVSQVSSLLFCFQADQYQLISVLYLFINFLILF